MLIVYCSFVFFSITWRWIKSLIITTHRTTAPDVAYCYSCLDVACGLCVYAMLDMTVHRCAKRLNRLRRRLGCRLAQLVNHASDWELTPSPGKGQFGDMSPTLIKSLGTKVCRCNWHSAGSLGWPFPMLKYKYIYFWNKIYGSNFIKQHSETVVVWNYQNADCSLRKILCHLLKYSAHLLNQSIYTALEVAAVWITWPRVSSTQANWSRNSDTAASASWINISSAGCWAGLPSHYIHTDSVHSSRSLTQSAQK